MKAASLLLPLVLVLVPALAQAQESNSPYIDELRREMDEEGEPSRPTSGEPSYTESLKRKLPAPEGSDTKYIEELIAEDPEYFRSSEPASSFTQDTQRRLGPSTEGGAIQAVREGRSDLQLKREGPIRGAAGFRISARDVSQGTTASAGVVDRPFDAVYGSGWSPDVSIFWEWQPFHSEWFGNLGVVAMVGVGYDTGQGTFRNTEIVRPDGSKFEAQSKTKLQFFKVPATAALNYRFNLLRVLRPFVMAGPSLIHYAEVRADRSIADAKKGRSWGLTTSAGVSVLLDWISRESSWNYYQDYGVKHFYLTIEYSRLSTFSGAVNFAESGILAGMTFEL